MASAWSSSNDSDNEIYFDFQAPNANQNEEPSPSAYLAFEPVVSAVEEREPTDWRRYEPPSELLIAQDDTSEVIRSLLEPSIARIKATHVEEDERRASSARPDKPLTRSGRSSAKPRRPVSSVLL